VISQESIGLQIQVQQTAVLLHKVLLSHMGSILLWAIRLCKSLQLCISTSILSSGVFWYVIICYSLFFNWLCSILWSHLYFQEAAVYQLLDLSIVKSWRKVMQSDCLGLLAQCTWSGCWLCVGIGLCSNWARLQAIRYQVCTFGRFSSQWPLRGWAFSCLHYSLATFRISCSPFFAGKRYFPLLVNLFFVFPSNMSC
jgi:hypothetical protein